MLQTPSTTAVRSFRPLSRRLRVVNARVPPGAYQEQQCRNYATAGEAGEAQPAAGSLGAKSAKPLTPEQQQFLESAVRSFPRSYWAWTNAKVL